MCGWWRYATYLADRGFRVLLFDQRCIGESGCPETASTAHEAQDVEVTVRALRHAGADRVAVVGASYGGSAALVAASHLPHEIAGVASLSGDTLEVAMAPSTPRTAERAARRLRIPLLYEVARHDQYISVSDARALVGKVSERDKQLLVLDASAGHGWGLLEELSGHVNPSRPATRTLDGFLIRVLG
jgi:pimeloyl-ACP methyl ester carboxylesterase